MRRYIYKKVTELEGIQAVTSRASPGRSGRSGIEARTGESRRTLSRASRKINNQELKDVLRERVQQPDHVNQASLLPAGLRLPAAIGDLSSLDVEAILYNWTCGARHQPARTQRRMGATWLILPEGKTMLNISRCIPGSSSRASVLSDK